MNARVISTAVLSTCAELPVPVLPYKSKLSESTSGFLTKRNCISHFLGLLPVNACQRYSLPPTLKNAEAMEAPRRDHFQSLPGLNNSVINSLALIIAPSRQHTIHHLSYIHRYKLCLDLYLHRLVVLAWLCLA